MSLFSGFDDSGIEKSEDHLGGGSFTVPTDVYDSTIRLAYAGQSEGGALNVTLLLTVEDGSGKTTEINKTIYVSNREKKNYYEDSKSGKKKFLPGYELINDICMLTTEVPLKEQPTEIKKVNQWDSEQNKEVPKDAPVLVDIVGKRVKLAIFEDKQFKQKKNASGAYEDTDEIKTENDIAKAAHIDLGVTVNEAMNGDSASFMDQWKEKWAGVTRDRTNKSKKSSAGGGKSSGGTKEPKKSLFS